MLSLSLIMRSTASMPAVGLLFLAVCFQAAQSQNTILRTDSASNVQGGTRVEVTSPAMFPALTDLDQNFYQRTTGSASGSLQNDEETWIERIEITMFFPIDKDETVTVQTGDFNPAFMSSDIDRDALEQCPGTVPLPIPLECRLDEWNVKVAAVNFTECTKSWTLVLEGVTCRELQFVLNPAFERP